MEYSLMKNRIVAYQTLVLLLLVLLQTHFVFAEEPRHVKVTTAAWKAFEKKEYQEAIRQADICIDEFRGFANRRQKELDEKKEQIPIGDDVTDQQKEAIFKNGPLNDVATCYYIKARAAHELGKKADVAKALVEAKKYPAARAWDPQGWFWSPAEAAELFRTNPEYADKAPHEVHTLEAWAAFNKGAYDKAMVHASTCIKRFHKRALEKENDLTKRNVQLPTGTVDDATKKQIFENGLLNDVSTCLFIHGKSAEARKDKETAISAYKGAVKLNHGRCWDPQGWFWSPAEAASDRLEVLR
jgi:tetratricopeptide (TPR) repeat protein